MGQGNGGGGRRGGGRGASNARARRLTFVAAGENVGVNRAPRTQATVAQRIPRDESLFSMRPVNGLQAQEWAQNAPRYNDMTKRKATRAVRELFAAHPQGRFLVGREYSPVVYFDTGMTPVQWERSRAQPANNRPQIVDAYNRLSRRKASDEIGVYQGNEVISSRRGYANRTQSSNISRMVNPERAYIRLWWD